MISALESETVFSGAAADVGQLAALSLCLEADAKTPANDAAADASAAAASGMLSVPVVTGMTKTMMGVSIDECM